MERAFILLLSLISWTASAQFDLEFLPENSELEREVLQLIPEKMKALLKRKIPVTFVKLDPHQEIEDPCRSKETPQVFGKLERGKIFLNKNFLPHVRDTGKTYSCGHKNYHRLLLATLIHELAHLVDLETKSSRSSLYQSLANSSGLKIKNRSTERSVDAYELTDVVEHFAVNTEYFLLDAEYACRRPNLATYLGQLFGEKTQSCDDYPAIQNMDLAPENVRSIEYLLAGKGEAIMSRFGHSMFRLVFESGSDLVIGFSGEMNEPVISNLKGLNGKYASRLLVSSLKKIREDYNKKQWRSLKAFPLLLSPVEKERFLHQVMVLYWEYSGRYFFFTNNCATEAMSLLKATYQRPDMLDLTVLTPGDILKHLVKLGLTTEAPSVIFPSDLERIRKVYAALENTTGKLEDYLKLPALERRLVWKHLSKKDIYALLSLEVTLQERATRNHESLAIRELNQIKNDTVRSKLRDAVAASNRLSFGNRSFGQGYGIPQKGDQSLREDRLELEQELKEQWLELGPWLDNIISPFKTEVSQAEENIQSLKALLRVSNL